MAHKLRLADRNRSCYVTDERVGTGVKQKIVGFHRDEHGDWVADLACGHGQHVRHQPPLSIRVWATTEEGRQGRLGSELNCLRCDEEGRPG